MSSLDGRSRGDDQAQRLLKRWTPTYKHKAYCARHRKMCCPYPKPSELCDGIWIEASGSPCVAWTSFGSKEGWLHPTALVVLVWARLMRCLGPGLIIHECSPGFPMKDLEYLLGADFKGQTAVVCPCDLGLPSPRARRYSLFVNARKLEQHEDWSRDELAPLFFRSVDIGCGAYRRASPQEVAEHGLWLARTRGLAADAPCLSAWPAAVFLSQGEAVRLTEYVNRIREIRAQQGPLDDRNHVLLWDISQHVGYLGMRQACRHHLTPTLLRCSTLWWQDMVDGCGSRLATPREYLAIQGLLALEGFDLKQVPHKANPKHSYDPPPPKWRGRSSRCLSVSCSFKRNTPGCKTRTTSSILA